jgi:hypothetical protein
MKGGKIPCHLYIVDKIGNKINIPLMNENKLYFTIGIRILGFYHISTPLELALLKDNNENINCINNYLIILNYNDLTLEIIAEVKDAEGNIINDIDVIITNCLRDKTLFYSRLNISINSNFMHAIWCKIDNTKLYIYENNRCKYFDIIYKYFKKYITNLEIIPSCLQTTPQQNVCKYIKKNSDDPICYWEYISEKYNCKPCNLYDIEKTGLLTEIFRELPNLDRIYLNYFIENIKYSCGTFSFIYLLFSIVNPNMDEIIHNFFSKLDIITIILSRIYL